MNLSSCAEGTFCLPSITVLDQWWHCMCLGDIRFPLLLNSSKEVRYFSTFKFPATHMI
jgi:hypothetical protein